MECDGASYRAGRSARDRDRIRRAVLEDHGDYDQEVLLAVHHWGPSIRMSSDLLSGCDIAYRYASFNDRLLSHSEPIRVRLGQRVLFRFLNASASEPVSLTLPHHRFTVVTMDGIRFLRQRRLGSFTSGQASASTRLPR